MYARSQNICAPTQLFDDNVVIIHLTPQGLGM